jgi:HEPN domain-containing protein
MKHITLEWVSKAEDDWKVAQREFRARKSPSYDAACFHSQQCAEKYLKARLEEAGIAFAKSHNLVALLAMVLPVEPLWATLHHRLNALNSFAVAYRYPGASATKTDARDALKDCREVRRFARRAFGLPL